MNEWQYPQNTETVGKFDVVAASGTLCVKKECTPAELDAREVQQTLTARGINLFD